MAECKCYYYSLASGEKPIEDFVSSLNEKSKEKFQYVKGLLEVSGHRLKQPYSKYLGRSIFELRFRGIEGHVRVLYFFLRQDAVVFTNGFIKKTGKIPKNEIDVAMRRKKECLQLKLEEEYK